MSSGLEKSHRKVRVESRINPSLLKRRVTQARRTRRNTSLISVQGFYARRKGQVISYSELS